MYVKDSTVDNLTMTLDSLLLFYTKGYLPSVQVITEHLEVSSVDSADST